MIIRALLLWVFVVYGCLLILLSVFKTAELFLPAIYQLESFLGGDKLMHLKLSAVLSFLALTAFIPTSFIADKQRLIAVILKVLLVSGLLILGLGLDELHQSLTSTRRFEWLDLAYGVVGIGVGFVAYLITSILSALIGLATRC